jgi:hypothetical protein
MTRLGVAAKLAQIEGDFVVYHADNTRVGQFNGGGRPFGDNAGAEGNISAFLRLAAAWRSCPAIRQSPASSLNAAAHHAAED